MTPQSIASSPTFESLARGAQFRDRIAIQVKASREAIFQAVRDVALSDMKLAWLLGTIRYFPARLMNRAQPTSGTRPFLDIVKEGGSVLLAERPPVEIILGSAGQLHRVVDQMPVRFGSRAAFDVFAHPDYEKLFISLRIAPTGQPGEQWLVLEHATRALSAPAEQKFRRYWQVIRPMGAFVSRELLKAVRARAEAAERDAAA